MMFLMHIAFVFGLLSIVAGVSLYVWAVRTEGAGTGLAKLFGILVIIFSLVDLLCIGYFGLKYWSQGSFETPTAMMMPMQKLH